MKTEQHKLRQCYSFIETPQKTKQTAQGYQNLA